MEVINNLNQPVSDKPLCKNCGDRGWHPSIREGGLESRDMKPCENCAKGLEMIVIREANGRINNSAKSSNQPSADELAERSERIRRNTKSRVENDLL